MQVGNNLETVMEDEALMGGVGSEASFSDEEYTPRTSRSAATETTEMPRQRAAPAGTANATPDNESKSQGHIFRKGDRVRITRNDQYLGRTGVLDKPGANDYWFIVLDPRSTDKSRLRIRKTTTGFVHL